MFNSLLKAATAIVDVPVSLAADVVTCGGMTTDKDESYTSKSLGRLVGNLKDATDPDKD